MGVEGGDCLARAVLRDSQSGALLRFAAAHNSILPWPPALGGDEQGVTQDAT